MVNDDIESLFEGSSIEEGTSLTLEHLRKALKRDSEPLPKVDRRLPVHPLVWENYKKAFGLSDERMDKLFIKTQYIGYKLVNKGIIGG